MALVISPALAFWFYGSDSFSSREELFSLFNREARKELFSTLHERKPSQPVFASAKPRIIHRLPTSLEAHYTWEGQEKSLDDFFDETASMGIMMLIDGGILEERYAPGLDHETRVTTWTALQTYLSTLTAMALEQGVIESLDDPVRKYAKDFEGSDYGEVSLRDLLNGRSGMDFTPQSGLMIPQTLQTYRALLTDPRSLDEMALIMESGTEGRTRILPTDPHVLAAVIQGAWGENRSLVDIMQKEFWEPLGLGGDAYWIGAPAPEGTPEVLLKQCCLSVRLLEFAHLGQIHLEDGGFRGQQYLPLDWIEHRNLPDERGEPELPGDTRADSSMGFLRVEDAQDESIALGSFGQSIWIDHANRVVIAHFSSGDGGTGPDRDERLHAYRTFAATARKQIPLKGINAPESSEDSSIGIQDPR